MSAAAYDSAAWRRQVIAMPKAVLSPDRKLVLLGLETFASYRDGTNARPGIELLADMCNLTTRAVRDALACGRDLGLIQRTELANRRRGRSDVYRMLSTGSSVPPEVSSAGTAVPPEDDVWGNGHADSGGTAMPILGESPFPPPSQAPSQAPRGESPKPGTSPAATAVDANAPSPNSSAKRKPPTPEPERSDEAAPAAAGPPPTPDEQHADAAAKLVTASMPHPDDWPSAFPDPQPTPHCPKDPNGCDGACPACRRAREAYPAAHAAWVAARQRFDADRAKAKAAWRDACPKCDDEGWVVGPDGSVLDVAAKCTHPRLRIAYAAAVAATTFVVPSRSAS